MFNPIELLHKIWTAIKKFFVRCLDFAKHIVSFFKKPSRLNKLKEDKSTIAVAIKENLDNGNYNVCNCLFDTDTNEVVDMQEDAQGFVAEDIDNTTEMQFGNKDMVILQ